MLYEAEELLLLGQPHIEYTTFLRRAYDILVYLEQPKSVPHELPEIAGRAMTLIFELGNDSCDYLKDSKNIVQSGLRLEIIDCANKVAEADYYAISHLDAVLLGTLVLLTTHDAYELGEEENFNEAFARQDEANCYARFLHFLGVLERTDTAALDGAGEIIGSAVATGGKVLAKGIAKGAMNAGTSLGNMAASAVTNPLEAASDFAYYRFALPLFLGNVILRACTDREKLWEDGRQFADAVSDYLTNSSGEQMAEDGIAFMVESLFFAKLRSKGKQCFGAFKEKAKNIQAVANLTSPVKKALRETTEKVCDGLKSGKEKISGLWRHKSDRFRDAVNIKAQEALDRLRNKLPFVNWRHVFHGDRRRRRFGGYHLKGPYGARIISITKGPDKFGVYEAMITLPNGQTKTSTFFPDHWSRVNVKEKIQEAYNNIEIINEYGLRGRTKNGMLLEFYFMSSNGKGKEIFINSVYPIME